MAENKTQIPPGETGAPRRLGPRPLPLHLALAAMSWTSSQAALPLLKNGSLPWRPELAAAAAELGKSLALVPAEAFSEALNQAANGRLATLLDGVLAYRRHPYHRSVREPASVWNEGSTRLLDYGGPADGPPILVVPSLINRAYILDLNETHSLLRYLAGNGTRPFLVDWDAPGPAEKNFGLTDYIAGRLEGALDAVLKRAGGPVVLLGYCMGGLLALALGLRRQADLSGLALMATPWDFHGENPVQARAAAALAEPLLPMFERLGQMPVDMLQALFASLDPFNTVRKFMNFAALDPRSERAQAFVALEDWVNDGVPLTPMVAEECLTGWYGENLPARGGWKIADEPVIPEEFERPVLALIPEHDHIVPPASAAALAEALPDCRRRRVNSGHIGMVVGGGARAQVWAPLQTWLTTHATN